MPKILLVDDDKDMAAIVAEWLKAENFTVEVTHDGREGLQFLKLGHYDLGIVDWDLPGISGIEICKEYRRAQGTIPILMLTGKGHVTNLEEGLGAGADDFLTKPFQMRELLARVKALSRRGSVRVDNIIRVGDLELDPLKHRVTKGGINVHLVPKDFAMLEFLMRHPDEIFSSDALIQRVWNLDAEATNDAVRTSIKRLRKTLDDSDNEEESIIETVRRVGYRLRAPRD